MYVCFGSRRIYCLLEHILACSQFSVAAAIALLPSFPCLSVPSPQRDLLPFRRASLMERIIKVPFLRDNAREDAAEGLTRHNARQIRETAGK